MFKKKIEEVKQRKAIQEILKHLNENKTAYIAGFSCFVVGAVGTYLVVSDKDAGTTIQKITQIGMGNRVNTSIVNFVEKSTPSKPVHLVGTDLYFPSLSEAARQTGHNVSMISKNVNGYIDNLNGDIFEVIEIA
jgi:peptide subunit release factor 1 (eRF1)